MKKYFVLLFFLPIIFSCRRDIQIQSVELPSTQVLTKTTRYGVITSTHLRLRTEPSINSRAVTTLWRGYILEIVSRSPAKETVDTLEDFWYQVTFDGLRGWVFGAYLDVFPNREEAEELSSGL